MGDEKRIERLNSGSVIESYWREGVLYRADGGPTVVNRSVTGAVVEEWVCGSDQRQYLHREGGPAYIEYRANGTVIEAYWHNGRRHRDDGPAYIVRESSRFDVGLREYWHHGVRINPPSRSTEPPATPSEQVARGPMR